MGMNHGLGMTVVYMPKSKVLYAADLVSPNRLPFSIGPDYNFREMERTLKEISKL